MATLEEFIQETETEINALKTINGGEGLHKGVSGGTEELSEEDYNQRIIDIANSKFDKQENGYKFDRQIAYGSIADQLDMMYWDNVNGTTTWKDHIAQVKTDNPKPE